MRQRVIFLLILGVLCRLLFVGCGQATQRSSPSQDIIDDTSKTDEDDTSETNEDHTAETDDGTYIDPAPGTEGLEYDFDAGKMAYSVRGIGTATGTELIIPAMYKGKRVTHIDDGAFADCGHLTSVTICEGVTTISYSAFYECDALRRVHIPSSVTSIEEDVFIGCSSLEELTVGADNASYHVDGNCLIDTVNKTLLYGFKNSMIPTDGSVTKIADHAFYNRQEMTSIVIPEGIREIGHKAFYGCTSLTSMIIPETVEKIESEAFGGCEQLFQTDRGVTYIGKWIIDCNENVIDAVLKEDSVGIAGAAFASCHDMKSIEIPDGVKSIGTRAFFECRSLKSITIPDGVTAIERETFAHCTVLNEVVLPNSVTSIGDDVFVDCSSLQEIKLPLALTSIGKRAFSGLPIRSCELPDGVTSIGERAFASCGYLSSLKMPAGAVSIGRGLFEYCQSLASIDFLGTRQQWEAIKKDDFWDRNAVLSSIRCIDGDIQIGND